MQDLTYDISAAGTFNVTTYICGFNSNGLDICLLSTSLRRLSALRIRYLILDSAFTKIVHFYGSARYFVQGGGSDNYNTANPVVNTFSIPTINTVGTTRVFTFLNGFNATATSPNYAFDLQMSATYLDSNTLQITTQPTNS